MLTHKKRLLEIYSIAAQYRLDGYLPDRPEFAMVKRLIRLHPKAARKKPTPYALKHALEEMGTLFIKLGQLLSTRSDLLPPHIIAELSLLQDKVRPFDVAIVKEQIRTPITGLGADIDELFLRFDDKPLASASIAQVHTAALADGKEVVIKVVRPDIYEVIVSDFEILRQVARFVSDRNEAARAINLREIVEDYRQIMLGELDLTLEAAHATKMRHHFLGSDLIYVPQIYRTSPKVMVSERIFGLPINQIAEFDRLGYDRKRLGQMGLTVFFTQVFEHNFFHADMHAGNVLVETEPDGSAVANPRYIGIDCAIMGELSPALQLTVARMLLAAMNGNFVLLTDIIAAAGWLPPSADKHLLMRDMRRTVAPMINKPINQIDFAGVLFGILDIARRHQMSIPPQLVLLLKTLVHVEGLGRDLYPDLDIWMQAKPILTKWVQTQFDPIANLHHLKNTLPELLLNSTDLPRQIMDSVQGLSMAGARTDLILRQLELIRQDNLNNRRYDWICVGGLLTCLTLGLLLPILSLLWYVLGVGCVIWRITK